MTKDNKLISTRKRHEANLGKGVEINKADVLDACAAADLTSVSKQHTPKPWAVAYSPYTLQDGTELPAYEVIGSEKICDINENLPGDEQQFYAFLIATAPDLLDTLIALVSQINSLHGESSCIDEDLQQGPNYRRALSIIAKAMAGAP